MVLPTTAKLRFVLFQIPATRRSKTVRDGEFDEARDAAPCHTGKVPRTARLGEASSVLPRFTNVLLPTFRKCFLDDHRTFQIDLRCSEVNRARRVESFRASPIRDAWSMLPSPDAYGRCRPVFMAIRKLIDDFQSSRGLLTPLLLRNLL